MQARQGQATNRLSNVMPEAELISRAAGGDGAAFEAIMRKYNQLLFRAARSIVEDAGLGDYWLHRTGYSMGVSFSPTWGEGEIMDLKANDPRTLVAGMVFHTVPWVLVPGMGCIGQGPAAVRARTALHRCRRTSSPSLPRRG